MSDNDEEWWVRMWSPFEGCGRVHVERERCHQSDFRKKGKKRNISNRNIKMFQTRGGNDNFMEISILPKFLQWHALTREEQAKYYEQVINLVFVFVIWSGIRLCICLQANIWLRIYFLRMHLSRGPIQYKKTPSWFFSSQARKERQLHMQVSFAEILKYISKKYNL